MRKKLQRLIISIFCLATMGTICAGAASAAEVPVQPAVSQEIAVTASEETQIQPQPRIDVIVNKYRVHNGVLQYRRWNETRGCWVDPDWINM